MANDISTDLTEYMLRQSWGESAMREALINKGERPDITQERLRLFRDNKDSGTLSKPLQGDIFAPWWHYVSLVLYGDGFALKHLPPNSDDIQLKLIDFIDSHPTCTQEEFKAAIQETDKREDNHLPFEEGKPIGRLNFLQTKEREPVNREREELTGTAAIPANLHQYGMTPNEWLLSRAKELKSHTTQYNDVTAPELEWQDTTPSANLGSNLQYKNQASPIELTPEFAKKCLQECVQTGKIFYTHRESRHGRNNPFQVTHVTYYGAIGLKSLSATVSLQPSDLQVERLLKGPHFKRGGEARPFELGIGDRYQSYYFPLWQYLQRRRHNEQDQSQQDTVNLPIETEIENYDNIHRTKRNGTSYGRRQPKSDTIETISLRTRLLGEKKTLQKQLAQLPEGMDMLRTAGEAQIKAIDNQLAGLPEINLDNVYYDVISDMTRIQEAINAKKAKIEKETIELETLEERSSQLAQTESELKVQLTKKLGTDKFEWDVDAKKFVPKED